jgi:hypothetical protein
VRGEQGQDYLSKTNRELMNSGVIACPLGADDMFAITDIHVRDGGISIPRIKGWLPAYEPVSHRSYAFFGVLKSSLPPNLQAEESRCIQQGAKNGEYVAAAWRRI